jgi:hypothetical protein
MSTDPRNTNPTPFAPVPIEAEARGVEPTPVVVYLSAEEIEHLKAEPDLVKRDQLRKELLAAKRRALAPTPDPDIEAAAALEVEGIYLPEETHGEPHQQSYLIEDFLPKDAITLVVGESPSLLLIQLGLCVASGTPFLGCNTQQGKVLFVEFLSTTLEFDSRVAGVAAYLGIPNASSSEFCTENFIRWNWHRAPKYNRTADIQELIRMKRPVLTIINSLVNYEPKAQEKTEVAERMKAQLRKILSEIGGSVVLSHYYVKDHNNERVTQDRVIKQLWKKKTYGVAALTKGNCIFLVNPITPKHDPADADEENDTIEFVIERTNQFNDAFPRIAVEREEQDLGDIIAVGYQEIDPQLSADDKKRLDRLPNPFRFSDLKKEYPNGMQSRYNFVERVGAVKVTNLPPDSRSRKTATIGWWKPGTAPRPHVADTPVDPPDLEPIVAEDKAGL